MPPLHDSEFDTFCVSIAGWHSTYALAKQIAISRGEWDCDSEIRTRALNAKKKAEDLIVEMAERIKSS